MELMTAAPADRAGSAAGTNETSAEFGIALGVALLGSGAVTAGYAISSILAAAVQEAILQAVSAAPDTKGLPINKPVTSHLG